MEYKKVKIGEEEIEIVTNIDKDEIEVNESISDLEDTMDFTNEFTNMVIENE